MYTRLSNFRYYFFSLIYDITLSGFYRKKVKALVSRINEMPGKRVLEIGVGTGITLPFYAKEKEVLGVDPSSAMLDRAFIKASELSDRKINLVIGDSASHASQSGNFDHIVFCSTLSVLKDPAKDLAVYVSGLAPGACIHILNHFTPENLFYRVFDRLMTPIGKILGFKSYFPISNLLDSHTMEYQFVLKGYWSVVQVRRRTHEEI